MKLELEGLLMHLKDTVYDGEDLVEKIEHDVLHHGVDQHQYEARSRSSSSFNSSATKNADDRQNIHTADSISSNATSFLVNGKVYGRDIEFNTLRQLLLKPSLGSGFSNGSLSFIRILGDEGVGKTTLAQRLYSDTSITEYFQLKIWVYPSENFNGKRLTKKILQSANIDTPDCMNLDMLSYG
ncbi:hypothetical protein ZIOFF_050519 [Zingiber officinale]|uniref:NB-ARC domain-containing protein n=1 Tax=Zingiber officinale TaxID=94328 RepID=A0A8J5FJ41_ZINOF|nr:hypothetical protein ZIOFF_050519 [Zingiber officinale]